MIFYFSDLFVDTQAALVDSPKNRFNLPGRMTNLLRFGKDIIGLLSVDTAVHFRCGDRVSEVNRQLNNNMGLTIL